MSKKFDGKSWASLLPPATEDVSEYNIENFYRTLYERNEIWIRRFVDKQPAPWTSHPILRDYKFTNAYRELDRASQWLVHNVLTDHSLSLNDLLFRIMIYRFFNQPSSFDKTLSAAHYTYALELPRYDTFDYHDFWDKVVTFREKVDNPWHTAYLMNPGAAKPKDWNKRGLFRDDMYCNNVFQQVHGLIPKLVNVLQTAKKPTDITKCLESILAVSGFMSHEFYLDLCYCAKYWRMPVMPFDQNDFTNVGPGCSTGLRLIFPSLAGKDQINGLYWLKEMADDMFAKLGLEFRFIHWDNMNGQYYVDSRKNNLTLHTYEFWCCEYQKLWKMEVGEGKQRSKFVPQSKAK